MDRSNLRFLQHVYQDLLQRTADEKSTARIVAARELSPEALRLFEHVSRQRKGLAVAEARDGGCTVCHVRMRPQMFNDRQRPRGHIPQVYLLPPARR